jgi:hypothetical protein
MEVNICQNGYYQKPVAAGDRIHRIKTKAIARYVNNAAGAVTDGGCLSKPASTRLFAQQGNQDHLTGVPTSTVVDAGCCACTTAPGVGELTFDQYINGSTPPSPYNITYDQWFSGSWVAFPGATSYTVTTDYPKNYLVQFTGPTSVNVYLADYIEEDIVVSVTGQNECGASVPQTATVLFCFLAGSLVSLADGTTKPIEDIRVGDIVLGAFGEANPVLALHYSELGAGTMMNINGEHQSTSNHPHISVDKQFYSLHPDATRNNTYGRENTVINAEGQKEKRILHGLRADRIKQLECGIHLKTVEGMRLLRSVEEYSLPPDTKLYNLVVGGSHTYHVDGYAVTGWPREDDFDYDAWVPKA